MIALPGQVLVDADEWRYLRFSVRIIDHTQAPSWALTGATLDMAPIPSHDYEGHLRHDRKADAYYGKLSMRWGEHTMHTSMSVNGELVRRHPAPHRHLTTEWHALIVIGRLADMKHRALCQGGPWDNRWIEMGWGAPLGHRTPDVLERERRGLAQYLTRRPRTTAPMAIRVKGYHPVRSTEDQPVLWWGEV